MTTFQIHDPAANFSAPYNKDEWQKGYSSLAEEYDYWIDDVEGKIPLELHGTLFRNGPGLLDVNGQRIHHPFDGDGMVSAIAFDNGRAHFRNRFVRTEGFVAEQKAGRILYRGTFGTQKPGGWLANAFELQLKKIANTNVIYWGGKLLALWEAAEPYRLDPATLETLGPDYLDGLLKPNSPFGAHPRIDPACEQDGGEPCLVNFSIKPGLSSTITLYEFSPSGKLLRQYSHIVPGFAFIHDFVITPNYCIFFQNPVSFNPLPYILGLRGAAECIKFHSEQPTRIVLIPRKDKSSKIGDKSNSSALISEPLSLEIPAGFVFHHVNAFEQAGEVAIDSICYESLPAVEPGADYLQTDFAALKPGQLWRFKVNLETQTVQRELLESRCCEFPTIHAANVGHPYRYLYIGAAHDPEGNAPLQAILKLDLETGARQVWSAAPHGYMSEPIFVPREQVETGLPETGQTGAEDDGWLLAVVFDAAHERSDIVILDARDLSQGPVARLHLKHHIPYGLHGSFTPHCFG
jgi:all-trans-8'-apo-beta-carotenal 15,15'-oxygenase